MTLAPRYREFLQQLEAFMRLAHELELYRTTERLHNALNTARAEVFEVTPHDAPDVGGVEFIVGPIREQSGG